MKYIYFGMGECGNVCVCIHYESTSYKLYNKRTLKEGTFPFFRFFFLSTLLFSAGCVN